MGWQEEVRHLGSPRKGRMGAEHPAGLGLWLRQRRCAAFASWLQQWGRARGEKDLGKRRHNITANPAVCRSSALGSEPVCGGQRARCLLCLSVLLLKPMTRLVQAGFYEPAAKSRPEFVKQSQAWRYKRGQLRGSWASASCGGVGTAGFSPSRLYVGSGSHRGWRELRSQRAHHLAIIKQVINIFWRRMVRKQAADNCHELRALHRHLYGRSLFWLGVCTKGQKFRPFPPPTHTHTSFFLRTMGFGQGLGHRGTVWGLVLGSPFPLSPPLSIAACLTSTASGGCGNGEQRSWAWPELCETLYFDGVARLPPKQ